MSSEKPNSFSYFTLSSSFTPLVEIYGGLPITMSNFSLRQNIHSGSKKEDTEFWSYGFHSVICLTAASNPVISPLFCSLAISAFVAFMRTVSSLRFFLLMSSRNKESGCSTTPNSVCSTGWVLSTHTSSLYNSHSSESCCKSRSCAAIFSRSGFWAWLTI